MWWWARSCDAICVCMCAVAKGWNGNGIGNRRHERWKSRGVVGFPHVQTGTGELREWGGGLVSDLLTRCRRAQRLFRVVAREVSGSFGRLG